MQNNLDFIRKLPIPKDVKERYPLRREFADKKIMQTRCRQTNIKSIKNPIFTGGTYDAR
jgi:hypothetical protein